MELMKNLRWMCRICTVNIKKRKSTTKCAISILETPELIEKLKNYLFIEIDPGDDLPKKICTNCYDRIESFHNFVSLANKTENFYKDLINYAKGNAVDQNSSEKFQKEFATFALLKTSPRNLKSSKSDNKNHLLSLSNYGNSININNEVSITQLQKPLAGSSSQPPPVNDAGELVLNVSVNDPLIKDIENKIELAAKRRSYEIERNKKPSLKAQKKHSSRSLPDNFSKSNNIQKPDKNKNNNQSTQQILSNSSLLSLLPDELTATASIAAAAAANLAAVGSISYDSLNLGSVIKDMDLLKLILKALKWTYTADSLNAQIIRLKNTRLRDVITDPNLLQDADMTQILRSYLSPVLLQSQQPNNLASIFSSPPLLPPLALPHPTVASAAATAAALSSLSSYKIPSDTSVQIISVPSSEANNTSYHNNYSHHQMQHHNQNYLDASKSKVRRMSSSTSPIILSDDSNDNDVQLFEVSVDPSLFFPGDKEFFFHQYNNTESMQTENVSIKSENKKTRTRKRLRNDNFGGRCNRNSRRKLKNNIKKPDRQPLQQHQEQLHQSQQNISQSSINQNVAATSICRKKETKKSTTVIQDDTFKDFNIDSITLIEETSGDDEIWAEFKVSESAENSDNEDQHKDINIKKEKLDKLETTSSTKKIVENENNNKTLEENSILSKSLTSNTSTPVSSRKPKSKKEINEEQSPTKITDKYSNENTTPKKSVVKEEPNAEIKTNSTTKSRRNTKKTTIYPTSGRVTRPKTPRTYFNKRRSNNKKNSESPKIQQQTDKKKETENSSSLNREENKEESIIIKEEIKTKQSITVSSRKPNTRKRICKQCGLTFMNITDFVEHRKKHM